MIGPDAPSLKLIDEIIQIKKSYHATHPAGVRQNDNIIPPESWREDGSGAGRSGLRSGRSAAGEFRRGTVMPVGIIGAVDALGQVGELDVGLPARLDGQRGLEIAFGLAP